MRLSIEGKLIYPEFEIPYSYEPYFVPKYRGATRWEQECIDYGNQILKNLFSYEGFTKFFLEHHCCINRNMLQEYANSQQLNTVELVDSIFNKREFRDINGIWDYGSIKLDYGFYDPEYWLFDIRMLPRCQISIDGDDIFPLEKEANSKYVCYEKSDYEDLAYCICESSKYNIPYLYSIRDSFSWAVETGITVEDDYPEVEEVIQYCIDNDIITNCHILFDKETYFWSNYASSEKGVECYLYKDKSLQDSLRKSKTAIKNILHKRS